MPRQKGLQGSQNYFRQRIADLAAGAILVTRVSPPAKSGTGIPIDSIGTGADTASSGCVTADAVGTPAQRKGKLFRVYRFL